MDVLGLGRDLEAQAVQRELGEHGLLAVEAAAVEREPLGVAERSLDHPGEGRQVGRSADDLDRCVVACDAERMSPDERRLIRGEDVEHAV